MLTDTLYIQTKGAFHKVSLKTPPPPPPPPPSCPVCLRAVEVVCFIGLTGESRNIRLVLQSLCLQLAQAYAAPRGQLSTVPGGSYPSKHPSPVQCGCGSDACTTHPPRLHHCATFRSIVHIKMNVSYPTI